MKYRLCGHSGLYLPELSLGLWHNFGSVDPHERSRAMILRAWERGVTHFDIANNYGPVPGSAEETFGRILRSDLSTHRDEMIVSSKAGYLMWPGPYGEGSSRKNIIASCDQSLKRTGLEYFDIFYTHRYDANTPIEETAEALVQLVHQGKALYIGISNYPADKQREICAYLQSRHVPVLIGQYKANMLYQDTLEANLPVARESGHGFICFSPLAQGLLTDRYLHGIPEGSRATKEVFLHRAQITPEYIDMVRGLQQQAEAEGKTIAQMAIRWLLDKEGVTSVLVGASSVEQLDQNLDAID